MLDKKKQIKNSFLYFLPLIVNSVFPLIALPIFTRVLTRDDYGVLALAEVYAAFASGLAHFGLINVFDRNYFHYRSDKQKSAELLYSILCFVAANFLILGILTCLFKTSLSHWVIGPGEHGSILFWCFCAAFFNDANYYFITSFKNEEDAKKAVGFTIAGSLLNLTLAIILVVFVHSGVIGLVYAQLLAASFIFILLFNHFRKISPFSFNRNILFDSLKLSYPLTPTVLLGVFSKNFDKYMIGLLASVGGVGLYSIAQKFASLVFEITTALQAVFSPHVYKRMFDPQTGGGEEIGKYLTPFVYLTVFATLVLSLFSEEIISLLTPKSYHQASYVVTILAIYYSLQFFGKINPMQLFFTKKTYIAMLFSTFTIGLNIAFNIPFIKKWGPVGAASATLLSALIATFFYATVAQRYYKIKWEYRKLAIIYNGLFIASFTSLLLMFVGIGYPSRFTVKLIFVLAYMLFGVHIGVLSKENLSTIKNIYLDKLILLKASRS